MRAMLLWEYAPTLTSAQQVEAVHAQTLALAQMVPELFLARVTTDILVMGW